MQKQRRLHHAADLGGEPVAGHDMVGNQHVTPQHTHTPIIAAWDQRGPGKASLTEPAT
ncbi:hypothetical protein ACQPZJ_36900 [Actinoplanes sp. CA-054009]